ncbi:hypothetical protein CPLU01_13256 [Colletotrichum plurivorum]|uniref:Uncharacterized protein n=1 Tax=Colletotrichum plurivorum TaxID=2175906 RepID=A0A8H6JST2_9PEZI|nr:hypothetical protein CPLU01_13256 [Colletotrichum plurivorum]
MAYSNHRTNRHHREYRHHEENTIELQDLYVNRNHRARHGQDYYEAVPKGSENDEDCRIPWFPETFDIGKYLYRAAIFFLVIAIGAGVGHIVFVVKFVTTDTTGFEPEDSSFPFFKNSGFADCAARPADAANCSVIMEIISHGGPDKAYLDKGYTPIATQGRSKQGTHYDWCQAASCFNGYAVLPTTPQDSVVGLTTFELWGNINTAAIMTIWALINQYRAYKKHPQHCSGIGFSDWAQLLLSLAMVVWWWVEYVQFAIDPVLNASNSIDEWITTWQLAVNIHYHPFSCALKRRHGLKRALKIALTLLALAQWCATIQVLTAGWTHILDQGSFTQSYDCVQDLISNTTSVPGCSAQELCSDSMLLSNPYFSWDFMERQVMLGALGCFVLLTATALSPLLCILSGKKEKVLERDIRPILGPAFTGFFAAVVSGMALAVLIQLNNHMARAGPLVVKEACRTVHVGLSPWRYYLDVGSDYAKAIRIIKIWFNV